MFETDWIRTCFL